MNRILEYVKTRRPGWWISTVLLIGILTLIVFPGLRKDLIVWMTEYGLEEPEFEQSTSRPSLNEADYSMEFVDMDGEKHNLTEFKGEVIFINYWSTWCTYCLAEMNSLERLYKSFKNNVVFLFISYEDYKTVKAFDTNESYNVPFYSGITRPDSYSVQSLPTTIIISRSGELASTHRGALQWDSNKSHKFLKKLLSE